MTFFLSSWATLITIIYLIGSFIEWNLKIEDWATARAVIVFAGIASLILINMAIPVK